jgi:hypothetical protein
MPSTYDLWLAFAILSAPPGTLEIPPLPHEHASMRAAILKVAIDHEWLNVAEAQTSLHYESQWQSDLDDIRCAREECDGLPHLWEGQIIPGHDIANKLCQFNYACRCRLSKRLLWEPENRAVLQLQIAELEHSYRAWEQLSYSKCCWSMKSKRQALAALKDLIGEDDFSAGKMPDPSPLAFVVEIR